MQTCDFHGCLKGTNTPVLEKKEKEFACYGDHFTVKDLNGIVDGIPELLALLNRSWLQDTRRNRDKKICMGHRNFFTTEFEKNVRYYEKCLCPCDHKNVKRQTKEKCPKMELALSKKCLENRKKYASYRFPICKPCKRHIETDFSNDAPMDVDPGPGPGPGPDPGPDDGPDIPSHQSDSSDDDSDWEESDDNDCTNELLDALNTFFMQTRKERRVKHPLKKDFSTSDPSRKRKLENAVADSIESTLSALTPNKIAKVELFQATINSKKVEKLISEEAVMPQDVAEVIKYCNFVKNRDEEIRAIATLVPRHSFNFLKQFNHPKTMPDDDESDEDKMDVDGTKGRLYWNKELTYHRYNAADIHCRMTGYGLAPITKPEITRQRIKKEVALDIYEFITSSEVMQRTAFGTYKVRSSDGAVHTVSKKIRRISVAELIRKVVSYLRDYKGHDDKDIPKEGYLRKVISGVPALRSKQMRGITASVEYGEKKVNIKKQLFVVSYHACFHCRCTSI